MKTIGDYHDLYLKANVLLLWHMYLKNLVNVSRVF